MVTQEENIDLLATFSQHTTNTQPKPLVRYIAAKQHNMVDSTIFMRLYFFKR